MISLLFSGSLFRLRRCLISQFTSGRLLEFLIIFLQPVSFAHCLSAARLDVCFPAARSGYCFFADIMVLLLVCFFSRVIDFMASRRITLLLRLQFVASWPTWRHVASCCTCSCGTVASWPTWRRVASCCCVCLVGCVMAYMASRRMTLLLRLWSLRWTVVI